MQEQLVVSVSEAAGPIADKELTSDLCQRQTEGRCTLNNTTFSVLRNWWYADYIGDNHIAAV